MRLVRVGPIGSETPGALIDEHMFIDLSDVVDDYNEAFFASGAISTLAAVRGERQAAGQARPLGNRRFGAPFARPHQVLAIGFNYSDHASETGQAVPAAPIIFNKAPNTVVGPDDDVIVPRGSTKTDWEVELRITHLGTQTQRVIAHPDAAR